jgi:hypothetical protein
MLPSLAELPVSWKSPLLLGPYEFLLRADKKADYVFTVKDNQPTLKQDIQDLGLEAFPPSAHGND